MYIFYYIYIYIYITQESDFSRRSIQAIGCSAQNPTPSSVNEPLTPQTRIQNNPVYARENNDQNIQVPAGMYPLEPLITERSTKEGTNKDADLQTSSIASYVLELAPKPKGPAKALAFGLNEALHRPKT